MMNMVARKTLSSVNKRRRKSSEFTAVLTSAVLEWMMIVLLFIHALYSYLLRRLARLWELQTPCFICSSLDHLFPNEEEEFCLDFVCAKHKLEISSLGFCHVHDKLADVHGMCENCLRSFATENKSNSETYKLLAGTVGRNLQFGDHLDSLDSLQDSSVEKLCSCCNDPWIFRLDNRKLVQLKSNGSDINELDIPLPASLEDHPHLPDDFNFKSETSKEVASSNVETNSFDPLAPIGYSVLKITSDSESEVSLSDDDRSSPIHVRKSIKEEIRAQTVSLEPNLADSEYLLKILSDDIGLEERTHQAYASERSILVAEAQQVEGESHDLTSSASVGEHAVADLNIYVEEKAVASTEPDLISPKEIPLSSNGGDFLVQEFSVSPDVGHSIEDLTHQDHVPLVAEAQQDEGDSHDLTPSGFASLVGNGGENLNLLYVEEKDVSSEPELNPVKELPLSFNGGNAHVQEVSISPDVVGHGLEDIILPPIEDKTVTSLELELIPPRDVSSSSNTGDTLLEEFTQTSNVTGVNVIEPAICEEIPETCKGQKDLITSAGADVKINELCDDRGPPVTNLMDLSDAYKLVITNKGKEASSMPEQVTVNTRVGGDLKVWLSQISSARGFELSLSEMSPRVFGTWDDSKMSEASSPIGLQILQKRISLERNMSGFESLDGSIISEIEGENMVDRLKRQVEYDRKSMNTLYKELEEERNASAVAANQALAMITRLQEEKATLQMEALQYLRMMEEQAEYDVDALEKANALLAEKEKEVQDLDLELETYRSKHLIDSLAEKTPEPVSDSKEHTMNRLDVSRIGYAISTPCNTPREPSYEGRKKLGRTDMMNGYNNPPICEESLVGFEDEKAYISQCLKKLEKKLHLFSNNGVQFPNGGYHTKEVYGVDHIRESHLEEGIQGSSQNEDDQKDSSVHSPVQENGSSSKEHYSLDEGENEETQLIALEQEFSDLNERLKALEADRNFLEHTMNSLRTDDGIEFIQEIAQDLRELRRIGIRREQAFQ